MELKPVSGNTYYFELPSLIGVYLFPDRTCCLVDSGEREEHARQAFAYLKDRGYRVQAILSTHFHPDHCAGHAWLQEQSSCDIYASPLDAAVLENPILLPFSLYSAAPLRVLESRYLMSRPCKVTRRVNSGICYINGQRWQAFDLTGHTLGQLGWQTPDQVLFTGDSLLAPRLLQEVNFNFIADLNAHLATLDRLSKLEDVIMVAAHGGPLADPPATVAANQRVIEHYINYIHHLIAEQPLTREEVVARVITDHNLPLNHSQFFTVQATVSAFLSFLCNRKLATTHLELGSLSYGATGKTMHS